MRSSIRQEDGGEADNSSNDMDVSFDYELNLSANFEPISFIEVDACDEWKETMQNEYDALIKNGTWKLVDPPIGLVPIGVSTNFQVPFFMSASYSLWRASFHS